MEGITKCPIHCHGLECAEEIIVGVHSTGQSVAMIVIIGIIVIGRIIIILFIFNFGSGERTEGLKDKVFNLWAMEIEMIFDEEENV